MRSKLGEDEKVVDYLGILYSPLARMALQVYFLRVWCDVTDLTLQEHDLPHTIDDQT